MLYPNYRPIVGLFATVCISLSLFGDEPQNTLSITIPKPPIPIKVITTNGSELELTQPRGTRGPRGVRNHTRSISVVSPKHAPSVSTSKVAQPIAPVKPAAPVVTKPKVDVPKKVLHSSTAKDVVPLMVEKKEIAKKEVKIKEVANAPKKSEVAVTKKELVKAKPKAVAPAVVASKTPPAPVNLDTGMAKHGRVSTYLRGAYINPNEATQKLKDAGFKILSNTKVASKNDLTVIVFTNDALEKYANKKERGFMASLRLLIDGQNKQLSITNPLYFSRAFMQDKHDEGLSKELVSSLNKAFPGLKISKDKLKYTLLPKYQFMFGMPYYEDMDDVASGSSNEKLLAKAKAYNGGKNLLFTQKLSPNRILIGVKLPANISNFIDKTGPKNALLLPYPILLEGGEAKILAPKYYISIYYPMLKMSQFMKIASTPAEIENACEKIFK